MDNKCKGRDERKKKKVSEVKAVNEQKSTL